MKSIQSFFGQDANTIFETVPDHIWRQHAPVVGNYLAFNQPDPKALDKVCGGLLLSRSVDYDGLQLTYKTDRNLRGFLISDEAIDTHPYDTLTLQDTTESLNLIVSNSEVVLPHKLDDHQVGIIGTLFATAVLDKYLKIVAHKKEQIDQELRDILSNTE